MYKPKNDSDNLNQRFLFTMTATDLLVAIVNGDLNAVELAKRELDNRGLNDKGKWVGFKTDKK